MVFDPNTLTTRLVKAGEEWADKDAAATLLEETKSTVLSQLIQIQLGQNDSLSMAKAEVLAKSTQAFREHLAKMVEARKEANKARVRWISGQAHVDLIRSMEASRRAEMKL